MLIRRGPREFQIGDEVFLRLQPYKQTTVAMRRQLKLSAKYFGPYKVIEKIGNVAYKLALPPSSRIHPVFHVSLLKKKISSKYFPSMNLPEFEDEVFKIYPIAILGRRRIPRNNVGVPQVLIQWSHSSLEQATWEDYHAVSAKFPDFDPWGQGGKNGGGSVATLTENTTLKSSRLMKCFNGNHTINGTDEFGSELRKESSDGDVLAELGQPKGIGGSPRNDVVLGTVGDQACGHVDGEEQGVGVHASFP
ncbi:hypothetical protein Sango_1605900 [Sesamum angolense]|uniref:Tf2-1-like SH3-like domain-containing protein n=1 Tax=Sesamum angolense TaxID=2727404 RepID=A0AAE1WJQ0_9LAMI|nr:hypothetical protein Sango_1605900 [Sesamum angolense]